MRHKRRLFCLIPCLDQLPEPTVKTVIAAYFNAKCNFVHPTVLSGGSSQTVIFYLLCSCIFLPPSQITYSTCLTSLVHRWIHFTTHSRTHETPLQTTMTPSSFSPLLRLCSIKVDIQELHTSSSFISLSGGESEVLC